MRLRKRNFETLRAWHTWFAWHPVRTEGGDIVWLERVRRQLAGYRAPTSLRATPPTEDEKTIPVWTYV